jgi:hypothetical protein
MAKQYYDPVTAIFGHILGHSIPVLVHRYIGPKIFSHVPVGFMGIKMQNLTIIS